MAPYADSTLRIDVNRNGQETVLAWSGRSTDRVPGLKLTPYLEGLVGELKGHDVTLSFAALEYMNSSTVPPLIQFMKRLDGNGIQTRVVYDANSRWQRASFKAFEALALRMPHVSVVGK